MSADLTHLGHRVPDRHGYPGEDERRHAAEVAEQRLHAAAQVLVRCLTSGDEGAARRHLQALRLDPASGVDPWALALAATVRAVRMGGGSQRG